MRMREISERATSFDYDYPMRCPSCREVTTVSAQDYYNQVNECHLRCSGCGDDLHFGPAVAAIREPTDPSLDDNVVSKVAWYHTSTDPNWPLPQRPAMELGPLAAHMPAEVVARTRRRHADQALHVGTYEASIESMLRRMRDQDDAGSEFFLYRVALRTKIEIEPGYRDENEEEAARVTRSQIRSAGFQAIRYLNAWEATGSLSFAVCRQAIEAVQGLRVPVPGLSVPIPDGLLSKVDKTLQRIRRLEVRAHREPSPGAARPQPSPDLPVEYWRLKATTRDRIARALLHDVSPVIRDDVEHALACWEPERDLLSAKDLVGRWGAVAALMVLPEEVIARLSQQPARSL